MATCKECHKQVRGELHVDMATPTVVADVSNGGGLVAAVVYLHLICPHDDAKIVSKVMMLEELFDHRCRYEMSFAGAYILDWATARPTDQTILRPDKRSSRRWLGADITIALQCPRCRDAIRMAVTVGDYALDFLTAA